MAENSERDTDRWVDGLLKEANIVLEAEKSTIKEIQDALRTASKNGTGNIGKPEYIGVVKDFIIVIEDKRDISMHEKDNELGVISLEVQDVKDYAVNGALFYAKHLVKNTSYKKVIAIGVSGNAKRHKITPIYVEDTEPYTRLDDVESFISFNDFNIDDYYRKVILEEDLTEKELKEILKDAADLHEDLRVYGSLGTREKPIVVSGILLALDEIDKGGFSLSSLTGDTVKTDGQKIFEAIEAKFARNPIKPEKKKDKVLLQFSIFKTNEVLNSINVDLGKTPLKYYAEFLYENVYKSIKYTSSSEDYLGRFYSEFMSYGGGDGQNLGIVLTPKHITDLFCDLANLKTDSVVLDPCCGTAGFLVAAMHHMLKLTDDETIQRHIRQQQLHGIELEDYMFTIAVTNMILRGDGKSNIESADFFSKKAGELQLKGANVGMINPPYSLAKKKKNASLYEICFIEHMLDSLVVGGIGIAIVPQSSMTGKTKEEQAVKENILKHHTLEGVITLNKDTFYGVGVIPCIAVFTAGIPHSENKECKFINFENDGFKIAPHVGLIETEKAVDKKQHLLDVWFDRIEADTKFCVKTTIEATDEWLHSFYYFNDEIPTDADFEKTVGNYLSFEFSMIMQGRQYLFEDEDE
ncbi:MAG: N-6 DNA methylase [Lachnospiraceae bacterium]|nr:N-6 DNA methylase [Lachnospiraceae bacterium]